MKFYLNVICNKNNSYSIREQIESFVYFLDAELTYIEGKTYWKEEKCFQFLAEFSCAQYDSKIMQEAIEQFWDREHEVCSIEEQGHIEIAVFSSISEILQGDKVYFTINFTKG